MEKTSRKEILACSAGWVAVVLNVFPGLGTGYLYQRRWRAYWTTGAVSTFWVLLGLIRESGIDRSDPASMNTDQIGFYGLFVIAVSTALEAGLAVKQAREISEK